MPFPSRAAIFTTLRHYDTYHDPFSLSGHPIVHIKPSPYLFLFVYIQFIHVANLHGHMGLGQERTG